MPTLDQSQPDNVCHFFGVNNKKSVNIYTAYHHKLMFQFNCRIHLNAVLRSTDVSSHDIIEY